MNSTAGEPRSADASVWRGLPDPTVADGSPPCDYTMSLNTWKHVITKHVTNPGEPWSDWLPRDVVLELRDLRDRPDDARLLQLVREIEPVVAAAVRASSERPLVLSFRQHRYRQRRDTDERWLFVLPSGAIAVASVRSLPHVVITCYFPHADLRFQLIPAAGRWKRVVGALVYRYGQEVGGKRMEPPRSYTVPIDDEDGDRVVRCCIEFHRLETWGFDPSTSPAAWRNLLKVWPAAGAAAHATSRFLLAPRFHPKRSNDE